jgi:hypothetical protein
MAVFSLFTKTSPVESYFYGCQLLARSNIAYPSHFKNSEVDLHNNGLRRYVLFILELFSF